jgi:hypothetical protein
MKNLFIFSVATIVFFTYCKKNKTKTVEPTPICNENKTLEGIYTATNYTPTFGQPSSNKDTMEIVFTGMNSECKSTYIIKKLNKTLNAYGCFSNPGLIEYHLVENKIVDLLGGEVLKLDPQLGFDLQFEYSCSGSYINHFNYIKL